MQKGKIFGDKKKVADILLICGLLVIALSVFLIIELTRGEGAAVEVSVDGEVVAIYSLSVDGEYSLNGGTNILMISSGEAYMIEADCPDDLCVGQGAVSREGQTIVCLPNRVMIRVIGAESDVDLEVR